MDIKNCLICKTEFESTYVEIGGRQLFHTTLCPKCAADREAEIEKEAIDRRVKHLSECWQKICPPLYRDTDITRLPEPFIQLMDSWTYGPKGIGLVGPAGTMKTRAAFKILETNHFQGVSCDAVSCVRFAKLTQDQFADDYQVKRDARDALQRLNRFQLILIDDLGKSKMTERVETELFSLLEERTSHLLPTIWTANTAEGDELLKMLSPDRGEPIIRRLAEFSQVVTLA